jgi:hypothetical protein
VAAMISVPAAATSRAATAIVAVMDSVVFGLMTLIFICVRLTRIGPERIEIAAPHDQAPGSLQIRVSIVYNLVLPTAKPGK